MKILCHMVAAVLLHPGRALPTAWCLTAPSRGQRQPPGGGMLEPMHVSKCDLGMLRWVLAEPLWVAKASLSWGHRSALVGAKPCPRQAAWPRVVGSVWGVMLYRTSPLASLAVSPRSWVRQAPPPCLPAWLLQNSLHSTWWQWSLLWWMLSGGLHIPLPLTSSSLLSQFALSSFLPN